MNNNNDKLDWMYKSANSLVDREEYLLGRSVDKTLDQLNAEEKEKKLGLVAPKNHVEHECIPPSIRDFNKVVAAEQVDLNAKLQEDPLVAIKKREEEARRQFLQNPVQLKKLQEALKAQEAKRNKKQKKVKGDSDSDLDSKIVKKLKYLKNGSLPLPVTKKKKNKSEDDTLDTILMHKFNSLKDRLSQEDLNDILAGKVSDSDDDEEKKTKRRRKQRNSSSDESEIEAKRKGQNKRKRSGCDVKKTYRNRTTVNDYKRGEQERNKSKGRYNKHDSSSDERTKSKTKRRSSSDSSSEERRPKKVEVDRPTEVTNDTDLETRILQKLRMLRDSVKSNNSETSDSDSETHKPKNFGLVSADGNKIALSKKSDVVSKTERLVKVDAAPKTDRKNIKRMTEEEKERMRKEMMKDAKYRDKERSENLRRYREEDKEEESKRSSFDKEFVHKQLLKTTKESTVESRIKSNLNNIQRSSRHMDSHFSKR